MNKTFDGILAQAFIHLFPSNIIDNILLKMTKLLNDNGKLLITTTRSKYSIEGWFPKIEYNNSLLRYRKYWKEKEIEKAIINSNLKIINKRSLICPLKKEWIIFYCSKNS